MPRKKQHHIVINDGSGIMESLEKYKNELDLKSKEEVISHFLPKSDDEYFEYEWQIFRDRISKAIPGGNKRQNFLYSLEALFYIGIVNGNKVSLEFIEDFKKDFGE